MQLTRRTLLIGAALALAPLSRAADRLGAIAQDVANLGAPDTALEAKIAALATEVGLKKIGFAAVDMDKGRTAFVRGGELFPMEGLNKLPIAVAYLKLVQDGAARLDARIYLKASDIVPGRSPIADRLRKRRTRFTARQLIEHMLLNGDTTATDALIKQAGGIPGIQAALKRLNLEGVRIDRTERQLARDTAKLTLDRYLADARDSTSARAMAALIVRLAAGNLVQPRLTKFVLDLMQRTKSGDDRLKAGMSKGWTFAHRAGLLRVVEGVVPAFHDAGLATSKTNARVALALCVERATLSPAELVQFHRAVARAVLEAWT
ncbi:MAG: serine hydrolase [Alphaproteobacteria bacterium]|nr:serine hydrolase [Alphaproteobacteria bacterium]